MDDGDSVSSDVLVVVLVMQGLRHLEPVAAATDHGITEDNLLHRFLRRYPWTAGECKAVADMDAHVQAEGIGLSERAVYHPPEVLTQRIGLSFIFRTLCRTTYRHQIATAQSHILHGLQVGLDAGLRDSAIHPVPEGPGVRRAKGTDAK